MSSVLLWCVSGVVSPACEQRVCAAVPGPVPAEAQRLLGSSQLHQISIKRQNDAVGTHGVMRRSAKRQIIPAQRQNDILMTMLKRKALHYVIVDTKQEIIPVVMEKEEGTQI